MFLQFNHRTAPPGSASNTDVGECGWTMFGVPCVADRLGCASRLTDLEASIEWSRYGQAHWKRMAVACV